MALNFQPRYKASEEEYAELNYATNVSSVLGTENVYQIVTQNLNIPVPSGNNITQTLSFLTDSKMPESKVEMYLATAGNEAQLAYNTITQFEVRTNQVIITRLGEMPQTAINVTLVFYEKRVMQ